jgi:hypothetical protein
MVDMYFFPWQKMANDHFFRWQKLRKGEIFAIRRYGMPTASSVSFDRLLKYQLNIAYVGARFIAPCVAMTILGAINRAPTIRYDCENGNVAG